jgi:hypothetical protein
MKITATVKYLALHVHQATWMFTVRALNGRIVERP